jgi:hypothetical protein
MHHKVEREVRARLTMRAKRRLSLILLALGTVLPPLLLLI